MEFTKLFAKSFAKIFAMGFAKEAGDLQKIFINIKGNSIMEEKIMELFQLLNDDIIELPLGCVDLNILMHNKRIDKYKAILKEIDNEVQELLHPREDD